MREIKMSIERTQVLVWSRKIRLFHWINVITVLLLVISGFLIYKNRLFGFSTDGKVLLIIIHVIVGYVFTINLLFRIVIGFIGKTYERWNQTLPFNKGFKMELKEFCQHKPIVYKGHNPAGKLMVLALLTLMTVQMITGLLIAGTDIYYPPFGNYFAENIAIDKSNLEIIKPFSKENVDNEAFEAMIAFRMPFIYTHYYIFYGLLFLISLHIAGAIIAERKERSGLISSMFSGYKYLPKDK